MSNSLDLDQAQPFNSPDLGPNCLQMQSADYIFYFVGPDLGPNCLPMKSADNILSDLICIQTVCNRDQQTTVCWADLGLNCLQMKYADNIYSDLNRIKTVCKCNQQTTFCRSWAESKLFANLISRRHFIGPYLGQNCLQI